MTEDLNNIRALIYSLYEEAGIEAETAQEYEEEGVGDCLLVRRLHSMFQYGKLNKLPSGMVGQDSGQPWFLYWLTNGIEVCNEKQVKLTDDMKMRCVSYLKQCHNDKEGGFSGAPGLQTHLASTYAAMMAIVNIGTEEAYKIVDIPKMRKFLDSIKNNRDMNYDQVHPNNSWIQKDKQTQQVYNYTNTHEVVATMPGSVAIHMNGEMDMRGVYCSLVVADILDILEDNVELTRGMADFIVSCQTYEGGIACAPYGEAHGGYTFCGLSALLLLNQQDKLNLTKCLEWLTLRQLPFEGGFNGRINKLVDSCYNFWQGASFELLDIAFKGKSNLHGDWLYNQHALQAYTIFCCQNMQGGVKDKPTKGADPYHTAYGLSGCSFAQHKSDYTTLHSGTEASIQFKKTFDGNYRVENSEELDYENTSMLGINLDNKLRRMNPIFNARYDYVEKARTFYRSLK